MSADAPQTDPDQEARKVHFDLPESFTPSDFLSCFQFQPNLSENEPSRHRSINVADSISQEKKVGLGKAISCQIICFKENIWYWHCIDIIYCNQNYFFLTGKFLFSQCISPEGSADSLATVIQNCNISPNLLLVSGSPLERFSTGWSDGPLVIKDIYPYQCQISIHTVNMQYTLYVNGKILYTCTGTLFCSI